MSALDIARAELALYVLTEYERAIEEGMDLLDVPPTERALAATREGLRKAIELARVARLKKSRRA